MDRVGVDHRRGCIKYPYQMCIADCIEAKIHSLPKNTHNTSCRSSIDYANVESAWPDSSPNLCPALADRLFFPPVILQRCTARCALRAASVSRMRCKRATVDWGHTSGVSRAMTSYPT